VWAGMVTGVNAPEKSIGTEMKRKRW